MMKKTKIRNSGWIGLNGVSEANRSDVVMKEAEKMGFVSPSDLVVIVHVSKQFSRSVNFMIACVPEVEAE